MKPLRSLRALLPLAVVGVACSSILGIEDVHPGPEPGTGADTGDGGDNGNGGTAGNQGGTSGASGNAGNAGRGGASGASGSSGAGGAAGDTGTGGEGDMGGAGASTGGSSTGGSGGADDMTVRGHLMSYWRTPLPGVLVTIGTADDVTDANGAFEIPDVAPTYDVKFSLSFLWTNTAASYGWVFEGLTRRDPTLQTFLGGVEESGTVDIYPTGAVEATGRLMAVTFGLPGGASERQSNSFSGWSGASIYWEGGPTETARWHGLIWDTDQNSERPTGYRSYATGTVAMSATEPTMISPDLSDRATASGVVSGTVSSPTSVARTNNAYVRFTSNATIELLEEYGTALPDPSTFSYVVPTLPNGSVTISALEGTPNYGAAACAHRENLTAGQTGITITIPDPPSLVAPPDGTVTDTTTQFRWTGDAAVTVVHLEDNEFNDPYRGIFIVTTRKQVTIPTFPDGFALIANSEHYWRVEEHGDFADVDAATGPEGYADAMRSPYSTSACDEPVGQRQGDGWFTISAGRLFTPAP